MASLASTRRLLELSGHRQNESERKLDKALGALAPLARELAKIEQQMRGLHDLLATYRTQDQRLNHGQLLALLRSQAVVRRQIGNLTAERARVMEEHEKAVQGVERLRLHRKALHMKHLKYQTLEQRVLREHRSRLWRQEENDIEELVNLR